MQDIGTRDQIKALGWKWETGLSVRTYHDVFELKVGNPSEALVRQSQHILTAIDAIQFRRRYALVQEGKQDACSTGRIQQAWNALLALGMLDESLNIESRKGFDQRPLCKVLVTLIIGPGSFSSIIGTHLCSLLASITARLMKSGY